METFKSMAFGSVVFALVLGLAAFGKTKASTLPSPSSGPSQISIQKLKDLLIRASSDAKQTFDDNCKNLVQPEVCSSLGISQTTPQFSSHRGTLQEMLEDMYKTCVNFTRLLDEFLEDVQRQGDRKDLHESLTSLRDISLRSVKAQLVELVGVSSYIVQSSLQADKSRDVNQRNLNNLQKVLLMAGQMDTMQWTLSCYLMNTSPTSLPYLRMSSLTTRSRKFRYF